MRSRVSALFLLAALCSFSSACGGNRSSNDTDSGVADAGTLDSAPNDAGGFAFEVDITAFPSGEAWLTASNASEHDALLAQCTCAYEAAGYSSIEMCVSSNTTTLEAVETACYQSAYDSATTDARSYLSCVVRLQSQIDDCIQRASCDADYSDCVNSDEGASLTRLDLAADACLTESGVTGESYDAVSVAYEQCISESSVDDCESLSCDPVQCSCADASDTCGTGASTFNYTSCAMGVCASDASLVCPDVCAVTGRVYRPAGSVSATTEPGTWTDLSLPSPVEVFLSPERATNDTFYVLAATGYPYTAMIRAKVFRVRDDEVSDATPDLSEAMSGLINVSIWGVTKGVSSSGDDFIVLAKGRTEDFHNVSRVFHVDGEELTMLFDSGIENSVEIDSIARDQESNTLFIALPSYASGAVERVDIVSGESNEIALVDPEIRSFSRLMLVEDADDVVWAYGDGFLFRIAGTSAMRVALPETSGRVMILTASRTGKLAMSAGLFGRDVWVREGGTWNTLCLPERSNGVVRYDESGALWIDGYRYDGSHFSRLPEGRYSNNSFGALETSFYNFEASPSMPGARMSRLTRD